jgi:hypothetical protein
VLANTRVALIDVLSNPFLFHLAATRRNYIFSGRNAIHQDRTTKTLFRRVGTLLLRFIAGGVLTTGPEAESFWASDLLFPLRSNFCPKGYQSSIFQKHNQGALAQNFNSDIHDLNVLKIFSIKYVHAFQQIYKDVDKILIITKPL